MTENDNDTPESATDPAQQPLQGESHAGQRAFASRFPFPGWASQPFWWVVLCAALLEGVMTGLNGGRLPGLVILLAAVIHCFALLFSSDQSERDVRSTLGMCWNAAVPLTICAILASLAWHFSHSQRHTVVPTATTLVEFAMRYSRAAVLNSAMVGLMTFSGTLSLFAFALLGGKFETTWIQWLVRLAVWIATFAVVVLCASMATYGPPQHLGDIIAQFIWPFAAAGIVFAVFGLTEASVSSLRGAIVSLVFGHLIVSNIPSSNANIPDFFEEVPWIMLAVSLLVGTLLLAMLRNLSRLNNLENRSEQA